MGICLGDGDHDCLTNLRFAEIVLLSASTKEQLQKMLCDYKHSTEKVGLKMHPGKTKILNSQSSNSGKEIESDQVSWTTGYIPATRDDRDQESYFGCLSDTLQIQTRTDLEIISLSASTSLIRHSGPPKDELRLRNMDPHKRARKNDPIDAAQNASLHHTNEKKIQKRLKANMKKK